VTGLSASAGGQARQANFGGDNYAPIFFGGTPTPAPSLHQLPPGIPDFSGRAAEIAEIEGMAGGTCGGPCIINVFGAPGIGKTALATHVAHRLAGRLDEVQLYAELGEVDGQAPTSAQVLQRFVAALDPATTGIPVGAQELPARYRSLLSGRRCLVVLDNAQSAEQVAGLIPGTASSAVLVTSRASLAAVQGVVLYHLGLMSCAESLALLASVSRRTWPDGQTAGAARALVDQCGCLPLALRIVGAILKKKPHWTLEKVAEVLAGEQTRLMRLAEGQLDVRSSFEVSYRHLSTDQARAFRLFSLLPLAQFKLRHAASFLGQPEDHAEQLVEAIVDAQLLETDDGRYFRFHDLIRLYAQERSQAVGDDPGGVRAARFLHELTGEFMQAYSRCLRETTWTLPSPGRPGWPADRDPDAQVEVEPDTLYVPARLVPDGEPGKFAGSWQDLLARHRRVLIAGAGGTGKTVLANRVCYEIAVSPGGITRPYEVGFAVPLRQRGDHGPDLETLIADTVRSRYRLDLPKETARTLLRDRRVVVIFDGLDEVPPSSRGQTMRDITTFCGRYPSAQVVVTSRPGLPREAFAVARFRLYEIAPLIAADVASYVERWQLVAQRGRAYAHVLKAVSSAEGGRDWLSTPLLITQLLALYDRTGAVPRSEIDLYDMTYSVLFERRETTRGIQRLLPPAALGRLVSYLSYELKTRAGVLGVTDSEFHSLLRASDMLDAADIPYLDDTLADLDLPVRRVRVEGTAGEGRWSVTRDPFSEYLAARWIVGNGTISHITERLTTLLKTGEFDKGVWFILPLAARLNQDIEQRLEMYLRRVSSQDPMQLPETTRAAIVEILGCHE
jgi:NACHT domain/NB-ARC domain